MSTCAWFRRGFATIAWARKVGRSKHFGNSEVCWVDNLLYLYTEPKQAAISVRQWVRLRLIGRLSFL